MNPAQHARAASMVGGHRLSQHAIKRMVEFGLTRPDVEGLLSDYDCRYEQVDRGRGVFMHQRGQWAMVVDDRKGVIVTILRRKIERWEH